MAEYIVYMAYERRVVWFILREGVYEELQPDESGLLKSERLPGLWLLPDALIEGEIARLLEELQKGIASREHKAFCDALQTLRKETI